MRTDRTVTGDTAKRIGIRPARAEIEDARTIHRFICELAAYEREPDAVQATVQSLLEQLGEPRPPFSCLIAELDGAPVGFALYFFNYSTWKGRPGLYVEDIYVSPRARGRGAGDGLFRELGRIAVERGCGRMEWTVLDWNEPAIDFYRARGASGMHEWTIWRLEGEHLDELGRGEPRK
ncbi:MAG: GNAT family N-acetyltransferase [Polyangia bacterium]